MSPIRIVLADDHPVVRRGLSQFIAEDPALEIVAECADGESAVAAVRDHAPDVLILDLRMPKLSGLEVLRQLKESRNRVVPILLAGNLSDDDVMSAMRLGAKGIVLKEMAPSLLIQCIRKVAQGGIWLESEAAGRALEKFLQVQESRDAVRDILTPREIEIVRMVAEGLANREVGEKLFISEGTVKTHLHTIFEKLGIRSRVQLATYARDKGLL